MKRTIKHTLAVMLLVGFAVFALGSMGSSPSSSGGGGNSGSGYTPGSGSNTYTFVNQTDYRKTVNCPPMSVELKPGESFSYSFQGYKSSSDVWVSGGGTVLQSGNYFYIRD